MRSFNIERDQDSFSEGIVLTVFLNEIGQKVHLLKPV